MPTSIQILPGGVEALVITHAQGGRIEIHPLDVIASYSELLGEPDPVKTVGLIRKAMQIKDQTGMWKPLYDNLVDGLVELEDAGTAVEVMRDLLEQTEPAWPVPGSQRPIKLKAAQKSARDKLNAGPVGTNLPRQGSHSGAVAVIPTVTTDTVEIGTALAGRSTNIKSARAEFLKKILPPPRENVHLRPPLFGK